MPGEKNKSKPRNRGKKSTTAPKGGFDTGNAPRKTVGAKPHQKRVTRRQNNRMATIQVSGPVASGQNSVRMTRGLGDLTTTGIYIDPHADEDIGQGLEKVDTFDAVFTYTRMADQKAYSSGDACKDKAFSLVWRSPKIRSVGEGENIVDVRGLLLELSYVTVVFENVTVNNVDVILNSPRTKQNEGGDPSATGHYYGDAFKVMVRDHERRFTLGSKALGDNFKRSVTLPFSTATSNWFATRQLIEGTGPNPTKKNDFGDRLFDGVFIMDARDQQSGTDHAVNDECVRMTVQVHYYVSSIMPEGLTTSQDDEFGIYPFADIQSLWNVDPVQVGGSTKYLINVPTVSEAAIGCCHFGKVINAPGDSGYWGLWVGAKPAGKGSHSLLTMDRRVSGDMMLVPTTVLTVRKGSADIIQEVSWVIYDKVPSTTVTSETYCWVACLPDGTPLSYGGNEAKNTHKGADFSLTMGGFQCYPRESDVSVGHFYKQSADGRRVRYTYVDPLDETKTTKPGGILGGLIVAATWIVRVAKVAVAIGKIVL